MSQGFKKQQMQGQQSNISIKYIQIIQVEIRSSSQDTTTRSHARLDGGFI